MGLAKKKSVKDDYIGRVIAGRYRLESQLGEGGMGVVYRARHVLIDRVVALKLIRPDLRGETHLRAWMLREARAANRVDHAHIVDIHDVGETDDGELYLVMEYLTGTALSTAIGKGPMDIGRAVDILEQMCAALSRAHDLGVIHRDLKSDNIMLTSRGGRQDFVKILDFGLAALTRDPRLAPKGAVFGTPEYMSPEQARGEDAIAGSDLYALGILFYEMVTGELPFRSSSRDELLEMQRTKGAAAPSKKRKDIPEAAEQMCLKLLEKAPQSRYRDGHHLMEDLKALQRSLPSKVWDVQSSDKRSSPAEPPPPPPAPSPGVVEWSQWAANFVRATARAYPNGKAPEKVQRSAENIWELASKAARLEGELASHSKKLDAIEKRGRALRAEIGRKVEELAGEESRALREAAVERNHAEALEHERDGVAKELEKTERLLGESSSEEVALGIGRSRATVEVLSRIIGDYSSRADKKEEYGKGLRKQIEDLRAQLKRYSEALENDLQAGRDRIASRVQEALDYEKKFASESASLRAHLEEFPECRELLEDIGGNKKKKKQKKH